VPVRNHQTTTAFNWHGLYTMLPTINLKTLRDVNNLHLIQEFKNKKKGGINFLIMASSINDIAMDAIARCDYNDVDKIQKHLKENVGIEISKSEVIRIQKTIIAGGATYL